MTQESFRSIEGKLRAVALLEAADRAGLTPIPIERVHALAYLADILSPVWGLTAFDKVALKTERSPFFTSFQESLDCLVFEGIAEVSGFRYRRKSEGSPLALEASYYLRYESTHLGAVIDFIEDDDLYSKLLAYFEALVIAMSRLRDSEIADAARKDASWESGDIAAGDIIEIRYASGESANTPTRKTLEIFEEIKNKNINLSPSAQLRLYASYLGDRLNAA